MAYSKINSDCGSRLNISNRITAGVCSFKTNLLIVALFGYLGAVQYNHWIVGMEYEREIERYFDFADSASDAKLKADYFNQFIASIEKHELTEGTTSVLFQEQPHASLADKYKIAKSLQKRLNELASMDENSEQYQYGMRQVTNQEFCWFPINSFHDAYMIKQGAWGVALLPATPQNLCYVPSD